MSIEILISICELNPAEWRGPVKSGKNLTIMANTTNQIRAKKVEMTQVFREDGVVVPTTIVQLMDEVQLEVGDKVKVVGKSKGKGFAGVIKRWGFHGGPKTHGQKDKHRAPGSIGGGTDPARVWKGKKMPGRMGGQRVTVQNIRVIEVEEGGTQVWLKGAVPGGRSSKVLIVKS